MISVMNDEISKCTNKTLLLKGQFVIYRQNFGFKHDQQIDLAHSFYLYHLVPKEAICKSSEVDKHKNLQSVKKGLFFHKLCSLKGKTTVYLLI